MNSENGETGICNYYYKSEELKETEKCQDIGDRIGLWKFFDINGKLLKVDNYSKYENH